MSKPMKVNAPCPVCGQPSHWANAASNYVHPDCDTDTLDTRLKAAGL